MLAIYFILYIIAFIVNSFIYKKKLNSVNIIISLWCIASILSMFGFYGMFIPNTTTYIYILIFLITFEIFSFIFYKVIKKGEIKKETTKEETKEKKLEEDINWKLMNVAMIICIIIMAYFAFIGLKILLTEGGLSSVRDAWLGKEIANTKVQLLLSIVVFSLGTAIGIYSVLEYVEHKKIKVSLILYFIFLLEIIFATATRGKIVYFAGIIVIALLDKYENNLKGLIKENKKIIIFLAIMFLIVFIVTLQRNLSGGGFLYNIYAYFIGSIHLLGQYLKQPETYLLTSQNYLYGQVLISGFVYPITFIMRLFGMKIMAGIYIVNEVTQKYIPVSNVTTMNNNVTFLYSALRDFGVLGLIIYPMILAFFLMKFYNKKEKEKTLYSKAMYDFFLINAIFLLFDFKFSDPSTIWTFLFIYIFYKLTPNKIKEIKSKMIEITKLREKK